MSIPPDSLVDRLKVAEPCDASWDAMDGDERKRFCGDCKLHVYNFSAMKATEVAALVEGAEGRVCGRFLRRADGTVITQDCGPLRRAIQRRLRRVRVAASAVFALLASFAGVGCGSSDDSGVHSAPTTALPTTTPPATQNPKVEPIQLMGEVCDPREAMGRIRAPIVHPKQAPNGEDGQR